jgi:2-keto-3-deoxy-L-rhamnonate aldolase RhmA
VIAGMRAENERVMVIPLIETAKGIENVEAIMAVPGVDLGWFGHYDLSDSLGITAQFDHPMFQAALTRFLKACEAAGKPAGVLGAGMEMVRGWRAKGFRCLCYGSDVSVFQSALKGALDTLKGEAG